jgi:hypothetical protein
MDFAPTRVSSSTINRQPRHRLDRRDELLAVEAGENRGNVSRLAGRTRPARTSPVATSSASKAICARCTSSPTNTATATSSPSPTQDWIVNPARTAAPRSGVVVNAIGRGGWIHRGPERRGSPGAVADKDALLGVKSRGTTSTNQSTGAAAVNSSVCLVVSRYTSVESVAVWIFGWKLKMRSRRPGRSRRRWLS